MSSFKGQSHLIDHVSQFQGSQESFPEEAISLDLGKVATSFQEILQASRSVDPSTPVPSGLVSTISMMTLVDVLRVWEQYQFLSQFYVFALRFSNRVTLVHRAKLPYTRSFFMQIFDYPSILLSLTSLTLLSSFDSAYS